MTETEKWAYSLNNEYYNSPFYDSYLEALKDGIDEANANECDKVYVGKVMKFVPSIDSDLVIEELQQKAYDEAIGCSKADIPNRKKDIKQTNKYLFDFK